MPPLVIPPLVKLALGAAGAAAIVHWAVKEARRFGEELDRIKVRAVRSRARRCRRCGAIPRPANGA